MFLVKKKVRVLMLGWEFPPLIAGGLGTYLYNFTKELSKKVEKIYFLLPSNQTKKISNIEIIGWNKSFELIELNTQAFNPYQTTHFSVMNKKSCFNVTATNEAYGLDFFEKVKAYTEKAYKTALKLDFDVIHAHDWMCFPTAIKIAETKKKPLILTIHSTEYDRGAFISLNPEIIRIEREGLQKAKKIITVSKRMKKIVSQYYNIPEQKIRVVYNGTNKKEFFKEKKNSKIILYVGRLTIQKGCDYFLKAAKIVLEKNHEAKFIVAGNGSMLGQLINQSIELGISNNVFFTGFAEDIEKFYEIADLVVMPSVSEPFGLASVEAISNSTPVIISKQSGAAEIIRHALKTDFWDTREMANKILGVLSYEPLKKELAKNAFFESKKLPGWEDVAEQTLQTYREALN